MNLLDLREPVSSWSHGAGFFLALPGTLWLCRRGAGDRAKQLSLLIYGLSLAFCYAASALFHGVQVDEQRLGVFQRLDHVGIFALIAGSYTPIAWNLLRGGWRRWTLGLAWLSAAAGAAMHQACGTVPIYLSTALYLSMGWGSILCCGEIVRATSRHALRPILVGGLLYSVGAVLNLLEWPTLWPGVFGPHELFHLFVLAGSLTHFSFMLRVVATSANSPERTTDPPRSETTRPMTVPRRPFLLMARGAGRPAPETTSVLPASPVSDRR
jgi:hemolysin III